MKIFIGLIAGLLFGMGLTISQMVDPSKVINFLDIFGQWDASLAFVMGGAIAVFSTGYLVLIKKRTVAKCGEEISHALDKSLDKNLFIGAGTFGIGWGLAGICPGPAIVNLSGGNIKIVVFILVMLCGMKCADYLKSKKFL